MRWNWTRFFGRRPAAATAAPGGFLFRLARDRRGNTLMIVAAAIFPLIVMIGGAVDMSRLYLVKTRLQHACDAGALAGRKQMGAGNWTTTGMTSSDAVAKKMFDGNFPSNAYGATDATRSFSADTNSAVTGNASANVPMTLMAVFSIPSQPLSVSCSAQQSVPNTDVMFVLDNTESMSETVDGSGHLAEGATPGSTSKIMKLKAAMKCFYEALTKIDTGETSCDPITGVTTSSRLRFGLVPYNTSVNIRNLGLPDDYFAGKWSYQSRSWVSGKWRYASTPFDNLSGFNKSPYTMTLKLAAGGTNKSLTWDGCTEEDVPVTDINKVPDTGNSDANMRTKFAPSLPGAVYYRKEASGGIPDGAYRGKVDGADLQAAAYDTVDDLYSATNGAYYSCPSAAYPLTVYPAATAAVPNVDTFKARVNAMFHAGNTRHDIGMLWGGRLLSPRGMMSAVNSTAPNNGKIFRHLIFMTDGDAKANECDYATYGIPWFDKRENGGAAVTKASCHNLGDPNEDLTTLVYSRLSALCTAIKAEENTTIWVISYGSNDAKISATAKTKVKACASGENYFFDATTDDELKKAFQRIAAQISQLRLAS